MNQSPTVHLPPAHISAWGALLNPRRKRIQRRAAIKNQIHAIRRTFGHACPHKSCWARAGLVWLRSLTFDDARQLMVTTLLAEMLFVGEQVVKVEEQLDTIAEGQSNVSLLRSIPGIGPRRALGMRRPA